MCFPSSAESHLIFSFLQRGLRPPCIPHRVSPSARPLHQSPLDFGPPLSLRVTPPPKSVGLWSPSLATRDPSTKVRWTLVPLSRYARPLHQSPLDFGPPLSLRETPPPKSVGLWSPSPFRGGLGNVFLRKPPLKGEGDHCASNGGGVPPLVESRVDARRGLTPPPCKRKNLKTVSRGETKAKAARLPRGMMVAALRASARRGGGGHAHLKRSTSDKPDTPTAPHTPHPAPPASPTPSPRPERSP